MNELAIIETNNLPAYVTPNAVALVDEIKSELSGITTYQIDTPTTLMRAQEDLKIVKGRAKAVADMRVSITRPLDERRKAVMDFFREAETIVTDVEAVIKKSILSYQQEQERKRRQEEDRLRAEARAKEEAERKRLADEAAKAASIGDVKKAAQLVKQQSQVAFAAPKVPTVEAKVEGVSTRRVWKFRVTDFKALPDDYKQPNEKLLGEVARATRGEVKIPGVEFYAEESIAAKGA